MEKKQYELLSAELKKIEAFLDDCDYGLAFEVSAKRDIGKRIFKSMNGINKLRHLIENETR